MSLALYRVYLLYSRNFEGSILNEALSMEHKLPSSECGPEGIGEGDLDGSWLVELQTTHRNLDSNIWSLHETKQKSTADT